MTDPLHGLPLPDFSSLPRPDFSSLPFPDFSSLPHPLSEWLGVLPAVWLAGINLAAFLAFKSDKQRSKRRGVRRIPERTLFLLALLGGAAGACLGMWSFRHKTRHWYFRYGMPLILLTQLALGYGVLCWMFPQ